MTIPSTVPTTSSTTEDTGTPPWDGPPRSTAEAVARARQLRGVIAAAGVDIDATGTDPTDVIAQITGAGLNALAMPTELGGLWSGPGFRGTGPLFEAFLEVSAGDGSVGQSWAQSTGMACLLFTTGTLPPDTRAALARELLHEGRRLVSSAAETGTGGTTVARRVDGGVVVDGVKSFNTGSGSGGRDLALVGVRLLGEDGRVEAASPHYALVRLDAPGVEPAHDWDTMGQRGTVSQTIRYREVFVPDGWHFARTPPDPMFLASARCTYAAVLQGLGEGALEAALGLVRDLDRPSLPLFGAAVDDPLLHRRIGEASSRLAATRALVLQVADAISTASASADPTPTILAAVRAQVAASSTALEVTAGVLELTGARGTSHRHRLDRFWRNARTLSSHDPRDASTAVIGKQLLTGQLPPLGDYFRLG